MPTDDLRPVSTKPVKAVRSAIPLYKFTRDELKIILLARDKRCISTGREGTDAHEVLFKRGEKQGQGKRSQLWHPFNAVLLWNPYHIERATGAIEALSHLQHILDWHGEDQVNAYIDWIELRDKPANVEQWAWRRAIKVTTVESLQIIDDQILINGQVIESLRLKTV